VSTTARSIDRGDPQRGRSLTARALSRYFLDEGTTTYTHVFDQHATYGTKVIPTTWREAVAVLDEIFGNSTDLAIAEHTTDTAGQTLATFAIFNLAGLQFSPRIRDIGRLRLYRLGAGTIWRPCYPHAGQLLAQPVQTQLIADHWSDRLRLVGSMRFGHTTASLLIAKGKIDLCLRITGSFSSAPHPPRGSYCVL
jgi:TnpA family transposase